MKSCLRMALLTLAVFIILLAGGYLAYRQFGGAAAFSSVRTSRVIAWIRAPQAHQDWAIQAGTNCPSAPFRLPTGGLVGYTWDDPFQPGRRHQGIDIFGGDLPGKTPVIAAYDGYLTRLSDWKSTVILRIPSDPLQPGRQIWTYYTHMATADGESLVAAEYPPGTSEMFVPAGTLLGTQGNYSGDAGNPVGVHLHFSIVQDDGGKFRNELDIQNTLDPSPYFRLRLNARENPDALVLCSED